MVIKIFILSVEALQIFKLYENKKLYDFIEAKQDKQNFIRCMVVTINFKRLKIIVKVGLKLCKLSFLGVKKPNYLHIFLNISKVKKIVKVLDSGKSIIFSVWLIFNLSFFPLFTIASIKYSSNFTGNSLCSDF